VSELQPSAAVIARGDGAQDPVALLRGVPLTPDEAEYVEAARAANTLRGYRSDWREFASWCVQHDVEPMAAAPATVTGYLSDLARHGAKVGTMSRRLSAIKFAHQTRHRSLATLGTYVRVQQHGPTTPPPPWVSSRRVTVTSLRQDPRIQDVPFTPGSRDGRTAPSAQRRTS
jgi:Phage integrase, N-terminal SAM-like domain